MKLSEQNLIKRIAISKLKPESLKDLKSEDFIDLVLLILDYVKKVTKAIEEGKIKGIDGFTPQPDRDYLTLPTATKEINKVLNVAIDKLEGDVKKALAKVKPGEKGKDAVVTSKQIEEAAKIAFGMIKIPDFASLITENPEAIRNSLELLKGKDRLDKSAIDGLDEAINEVHQRISKLKSSTGGGGKHSLAFLNDVFLNNLQDGQSLVWDATTGKFVNETVSGGGGSGAWGGITGTLSDQTDLQTALNAKQATITGLTSSGAELNILDGATLTTTELNYVDGVTSNIQTQLDSKSSTSHNHTGVYQPLDTDLTTIAGLTATTDSFMQAKGSAWAARTIAQVKTDLGLTGTNSGDQTSIVGITGTKAQFDTAVTDGNFLYVGDITQYTDELAQDAVGVMIDSTLVYTDVTPLLSRAALTGAVIASAGSNATSLGSFTKTQLDTAVSDGNVLYVGDVTTNATHTGEVTGSTTLTVDKTAITGKTLVTAVGTDYVLISDTSDSGNLKKALASDLTGGGGSVAWGSVTGTLSSQTDLQTALDAKAPTASPTFTGNATFDTNTLFVDGTNNKVGIGTILPTGPFEVVAQANNTLIYFTTYSSTGADSRPVAFFRRARNTEATPQTVLNGDSLGHFVFYGHDGTAFREAAKFGVTVSGTPGASDMPGRLSFSTTPDGSATPVERIAILPTGVITFGADTTSYPALKRSSANLQVRLGDDSAYADLEVADEAYDATAWNGSLEVPTKKAVRDKIEAIPALTDGDKGDITVSSSGTVWSIDAATVGLTELSATGTPSASTYLRGDNTWATVAGTGDVSKVGTPVDNQIGVWTGDGTLEGDANLTFDTTTDTLTTTAVTATTVTATTILPTVLQGGNGNASTVVAGAQYLGSTNTSYHWRNGAVTVAPPAGYNWTSVNLLSQSITEAASGTHTLMANLAIGALAITDGVGATTNAATLYIEGPATGTATPTNSYALWVDDGASRFDGAVNLPALTASELVITDGSKNLVSAAVATYPSLTQLSYVKGVTSAIQTQMDLKAPLASPTFTGTVVLPAGTVTDAMISTSADVLLDSKGITIDGGGSAITTGLKGYLEIPYNCTITGVTMLADVSGSAVVDIWNADYASYPPTVTETITASAKPTISAATKSKNTTLTGWTTSVLAGDVLAFNVDSASTITRLHVSLTLKRT